MKVAILGNMNNNGFALMRYLRDINVDAHLFLYSNDGVMSNAHFQPELDTFNYENWKRYIHKTDLSNSVLSAFRSEWLIVLYNSVRNYLGGTNGHTQILFKSSSYVRELFLGYDHIITSGFGPSILYRSGLSASIFAPYSIGVEGIGRVAYAPSIRRPIHRLLFEYGRFLQIRALRNTKSIVSSELGLTLSNLTNLGLDAKLVKLHYPLVYIEADMPLSSGDIEIDRIGGEIEDFSFTVLMHSYLVWGDDASTNLGKLSKNNHWVIIGFALLVSKMPNLNCKLIILEYGDVNKARALVKELNLEEHVIWVKKTSRKNIMWLLGKVSVGVGEFIESHGTGWGGTGWEVLASGKPLLQGFYFNEGEYEELMGHPEPPLLKVRTMEDVLPHLLAMANEPARARATGMASKEWFHTYNGKKLAQKWLAILEEGNRLGTK